MTIPSGKVVVHFIVRLILPIVAAALFFSGCETENTVEQFDASAINFTDSDIVSTENDSDVLFRLKYQTSGLGSQMGSMQPVLTVVNSKYELILSQTSYFGEPTERDSFLCEGIVRRSSIDSIVRLIAIFTDTTITGYDAGISSGAIFSLLVRTPYSSVKFELRNVHDPLASAIVEILNSNLPVEQRRLWIFPILEYATTTQ